MGIVFTWNDTAGEGGGTDGARGFQVWDVREKSRLYTTKSSGAKTSMFLFLLHLKYKKKKGTVFPYSRSRDQGRGLNKFYHK